MNDSDRFFWPDPKKLDGGLDSKIQLHYRTQKVSLKGMNDEIHFDLWDSNI